MIVLSVILLVAGVFFLIVSGIGLIRLPDFYSRAHAVGKTETLGVILILGGLAIYNGWELSTVKVLCIVLFLLLASPVATHAIVRSAFVSNLQLWTKINRKKVETTGQDEPTQQVNRSGEA